MKRFSIKVCGNSGMGLLSVGEIIMKSLKEHGFFVHSDREYPSLIKGGFSSSQIDFALRPLHALNEKVDILLALEKANMVHYLKSVKKGGLVLHCFDRYRLFPRLRQLAAEAEVTVAYVPAREIAEKLGGNELVVNMVLLGALWKICGLPIEPLNKEISRVFADKPKLLKIDLDCVQAGFEFEDFVTIPAENKVQEFALPTPQKQADEYMLLDGSESLSLGAIHAGVRTYYAYPMSPSSGILKYFANTSHQTGIVVKQAEDEITAVQMAIGSMYAGSRSLVATSGGGFDLMTESISLAGIIENPLVVVIAQRPGPGTGLPTWTAQGDLNLAIHAGHGEFARVVMSCADAEDSFEIIQRALNIAEQFQVPVMVLTEKVIAESKTMVKPFKLGEIPIERGLVPDNEMDQLEASDRYKVTENGLSKRWIPGSSKVTYFANGDEHWEAGELTEEADTAGAMYAKRVRKLDTIAAQLPEAKIFGPESGADISLVGWGSSKSLALDLIDELAELGIKMNYLHYEYLWPLKTDKFEKFVNENQKTCLIEGNYLGQLGQMLEDKTKIKFAHKFLKWNGRPFFVDEMIHEVQQIIN